MTLASTILLSSIPLLVHLYATRFREQDKVKASPDDPADYGLPMAETFDFIVGRNHCRESGILSEHSFKPIFYFCSWWRNCWLRRSSSAGGRELYRSVVGSGWGSNPVRKRATSVRLPKVPSGHQFFVSVNTAEECGAEGWWCEGKIPTHTKKLHF